MKINYKYIIFFVISFICLFFVIKHNRDNVEYIEKKYENELKLYKNKYISDSLYIINLKKSYDSLSVYVKTYNEIDVETRITKKGEYTYVVTTETILPDGTIKKENKILKIDTSLIKNNKNIQITDTLNIFTNVHRNIDTTTYIRKNDTMYVEKIIQNVKIDSLYKNIKETNKISFDIYSGISLKNKKNNIILNSQIKYYFNRPFFIGGNIVYYGDFNNIDKINNYSTSFFVGVSIF